MCDQSHLIRLLLWLRWPCLFCSEMPRLLQRVTQTELRKIQALLHSLNNHTVAHGLEFSLRDPASAKCPAVWKEVVGIPTFESTVSMRIPLYSPLQRLHKLIQTVLALVLGRDWIWNAAKEWLPSNIFHYLQWRKLSFSKCQASETSMRPPYFPHFLFGQPVPAGWDPPLLLNTAFPFSHRGGWIPKPAQNSTSWEERKAMGYLGILSCHCTSSVSSPEEESFLASPCMLCAVAPPYLSGPQLAPPVGQCLSCPQSPTQDVLLEHIPELLALLSLSDSFSGLLKCNLIK